MTRLFALSLLLATTACTTTTTLYDWGNYSRISLLETRGSMTDQEYADALQQIIINAEATNKVPPGIYAEYGFALLELGNRAGAAEWFTKERAKWPESTVFMDRLIAVATGEATPPSAPTSALPPAPPTNATAPVAPVAPVATTPPGNR